ncbi:SusC/RagA family TonB-linked outer membrane protein [Aridibaculum aurantiacum]|uniref:SusC/RagA family TonB-linked outer membrane protein n=1 Tax=Aridibaculum aurantiacum TaxID=2810307 RepID=UPI001A963C1B|nr:TonB-dependent receptor [Aridibaculum aurantiacum]
MKKILALLFALALLGQMYAQTRAVSGIVTDPTGSPMAGVSVVAIPSGVGTTTDNGGRYSISIPANTRSLEFSAVNFATQSLPVGNRSTLDVRMTTEDRSLAEVVVVGYGTQRRRDLTGSVASVSGQKIKDAPVQSFDQALSGRMAGVNVTMPNGVLNNPPVIRIRGVNSISLSSFPLVVIDGVPTFTGNTGGAIAATAASNPLGDINPSDIESVEVLKDAAATAIYGSRAAAGVLLITTKRGRQGRARVSYDGWVGSTKAFRLVPLLTGPQYTQIKNEGLTNLGTPPNGTTVGFYNTLDANGNPISTNWYDEVYRTGISQSHTVNVAGANESTNYYFSVGYSNQEGMLRNNDFKRLSTRMNLDHKVNTRLSVGGGFTYTNSLNSAPNSGSLPGQAFSIAGLGRLPLVLAPNVSPFLPNGAYNINTATNTIGQGANKTALSFYNPNFILNENKFTSENDRIVANAYGQFRIIDGLTFRSGYGIDYLQNVNKEFRSAVHGDGVQFQGAASNNLQTFRRTNWQNLLTFDRTLGQNHNLNILLGNEQQYTYMEGWGADRRIQADPLYDEFQGQFNQIVPVGNYIGENYLVSFFSRINYDYRRKYLVSINARRDGYSAFAPGNKYGNFGGASLGWVLSEENFFKNSGIASRVNSVKLRASYGLVGNNQGIGDYAYYSFFGGGLYGTQSTSFYQQAGNTNLQWETSKKLDVGMDVGLLNNRLNLEFTYFRNEIDGLILNAPQAPSAGIPGNAILENVGSMRNTGIELGINAAVIQKQDFSWNSNFNISFVQNKVLALAGGNADIFPPTAGLETPSIIRVGESIGSFYAVQTAGVNPANGQRIFVYKDGTRVQYNHAAPVASRWTRVDNGQPTRAANQAADGVVMGPALPKWTGGWDNTVRYKGFDLNMLLFFSGGNYIYNGTKAGLRDMRNWNNAAEVMNRWTKAGDQTNIPRYVFGDNISNGSGIVISENVEKGDFLKIRNLALGYTFNRSLVQRAGINSVRFYVSAQNLATITNYSGFDPEVSTNGNANGNPSVDRNSVPQARTITFGVNVGF